MPAASVVPNKSIDADGWRATMLNLYSHCGTHMDATCHFDPDGETLDQLNLDAVCGVARVIDLSPALPRERLTVERFEAALDGPLRPGDRLLLRTDWHHRYPSPEYRNELPRISVDLARYFVSNEVRLIGVEPPSVADVNDIEEVTQVHRILFAGGIVIVEGLVGLDQIDAPECEFIALPLRIVGGDGCPVRAIAIRRGVEPPAADSFGFSRASVR